MKFIEIAYTVGIRSRFIPVLPFFNRQPWFWRRFHVVGHKQLPDNQLRLVFPDTSVIIIPQMQNKWFKVFPDYETAQANLEKLKQHGAPNHAESATS